MPKLTKKLPSYRLHKASGQACVTLDGQVHYLGSHGSESSRKKYDLLMAEWLLKRQQPPEAMPDLRVCELIAAYLRYAKGYYVKAGKVTTEFTCITAAMRPLRQLYEEQPVVEFGPRALKTVRQAFIDADLARTTVNASIRRITRMFKWGVSEELVPAAIYQALATVPGLRKGRSEARESKEVEAIPDEIVEQTLPHLPPVIADMVRLQRLAGTRPGEIIQLCPGDIDREGEVWAYRPGSHKTEHHGKKRVIFFGPKAQEILLPYLDRPNTKPCFSPAESEQQRLKRRHAERRTPLSCGTKPNGKPTKRKLKNRYSKDSYRKAVQRVCERHQIPKWTPNQLRHTAATELRKSFGIDAARTVLGHSTVTATQIYSEQDLEKAASIAQQVG